MSTTDLNTKLQATPFVEGYAPSKADEEALQKLFGGNMKTLNWAARMASYYKAERATFTTAAVPQKEGKKDAKKAKHADPKKPVAAIARSIGGGEGVLGEASIEKVRERKLDWTYERVRKQYVDFFLKEKKLSFVPSSPTVPIDDPTLLFTNAGMNQFKKIFLGQVDPNSEEAKWKGAVNSQKCVRAGGKHNDLDDVGRDTYHHTFFEMLGNWSFGDYFKEEAIAWAWELMTEVYKLPKDQIYVTYFEGSKEQGLEPDLESKRIWGKYLPDNQILPGDMKDNFWEMGDVGPCGPCSELHFDRLGGRDAAHLVNKDDPLVLELWNLVFMTHMRTERGLFELPAKHVDTGMGLERVSSVLQGVLSNYDTDGWWPLLDAIHKESGYEHSYHSSKCSEDAVVAYRVVADHVRTITITLTDGGMPDNVGRGFVLRRIIRRAVRFGKEFLGAPVGFMSKIVPAVAESLGSFFPELTKKGNVERIQTILLDEEKAFDKTWQTGLKHFQNAVSNMKKAKKTVIAGEDAFVLHDRYGFPVDLTVLMAEKAGCAEPFVDHVGFNTLMNEQKNRKSDGMKLKMFLEPNQIDELQKDNVPVTDDAAKYVWEPTNGKVLALLRKADDKLVKELEATTPPPADKKGKAKGPVDTMCLISDRTPFYYESGGQIWDTGVIEAKDGSWAVQVTKVQYFGGYICHIGNVTKGVVKVDQEAVFKVDYERRMNVGANHTVTHQLNFCLRDILEYGKKSPFPINQRGSAVEDHRMTFDFSCNEKPTAEEVAEVENLLNKHIDEKRGVYSKVVPLADAAKIKGIRMMFGEKYPDPVRVVSVGKSVDELLANPESNECQTYSVEFCGGTHVTDLGDIQKACIIGEDALMKGIRRMTVVTRDAAKTAFALYDKLLKKHDELIAAPHTAASIDDKIKSISVHSKLIGESTLPISKKAALQKQIDGEIKGLYAEKKTLVQKVKAEALAKGIELGKAAKEAGAKFVVEAISTWGADREALNEVCVGIQKEAAECMVFVAAADKAKGKGLAMCSVPKGTGKSAVDWVKAACVKGGGNAEKAQTGFAPADEAKVMDLAKKWVSA